jgi:ATP-dependent helicase/nuclease subunit B
MHLIFGWELDGGSCPETPEPRGCLGAAVVGPLGLVDVLERWLGLGGPETPTALRVAQQLARLQALPTAEAFFARSLEVDGWATARELLRWRDELIAGGWQGETVPDGGPRLDALTAVEASGLLLAPGLADRAAAIVRVLSASFSRSRST